MKKLSYIVLGIVIVLAWAPWIRVPEVREYLINKVCPSSLISDAGCQYWQTNLDKIDNYPFIVILTTEEELHGYPVFPSPKTIELLSVGKGTGIYRKILITAFGTVTDIGESKSFN